VKRLGTIKAFITLVKKLLQNLIKIDLFHIRYTSKTYLLTHHLRLTDIKL